MVHGGLVLALLPFIASTDGPLGKEIKSEARGIGIPNDTDI